MSKQLIEEWQDALRLRYGKTISKDKITRCILRMSKKHNIDIEEAIVIFDRIVSGEKAPLKETSLEEGSKECSGIGHLTWFDNSCYMDSVLFSILAVPNKFIHAMLNKKLSASKFAKECDISIRRKLQSELRDLKNAILKGQRLKCSNFRALLKQCPIKGFEDFSDKSEQDAAEFLRFLFTLFEINNEVYIKSTYGTNKLKGKVMNKDVILTSRLLVRDSTPVFDINPLILRAVSSGITLSELIKKPDDSGKLDEPFIYRGKKFNRRIEIIKPFKFDYLVISLQRLYLNKFNKIPIIPDNILKLQDRSQLTLNAIVIWQSGHYVTMLYCQGSSKREDGNWWFYNDLSNNLVKVGSYKNMLMFQKGTVKTNGVLYFYVKN